MNTPSPILNMSYLQLSPSEVLGDVEIRWTFMGDRIFTELSYQQSGGRRYEQNMSPQTLRRRLGIHLYNKVCAALREAMVRGMDSE
jgi:hypothetical protein